MVVVVVFFCLIILVFDLCRSWRRTFCPVFLSAVMVAVVVVVVVVQSHVTSLGHGDNITADVLSSVGNQAGKQDAIFRSCRTFRVLKSSPSYPPAL